MTVVVTKPQFNVRDELNSLKGQHKNASGPAFAAYLNVNQNTTSGSTTKVTFNVKEFDTHSCFDTTTYRFTPNVAGIYQINTCVNINGGPTRYRLTLYKNGSGFKSFTDITTGGASYAVPNAIAGSTLIYLNGSTDYIEIYAYQAGATGIFADTTGQYSWINGYFVRGA